MLQLKQKISIMEIKKQAQENVIIITDTNQIKTQLLNNEINNKIKAIQRIKVKEIMIHDKKK